MKRKIVIACDSFKGCLGSGEVASAVAEGIRRVIPDAEVIISETADGGEGTGGILTKSMGGETVTVSVNDPLGRLINAQYGITSKVMSSEITAGEATEKGRDLANWESGNKTAIIEMAQASGLTLLSKEERNPLFTSTYGTGEMILDAVSKGCRKFMIGIGGSATNDGGTGMLEALGFKFLDKNGKEIKGCCGGRLGEIADIDSKSVSQEILDSEFIVACDVTTPFCGKEGATNVFASQKGADEKSLESLESGMQSFAAVINQKYGINLNDIPGTGAAGGLGGAFKTFLKAELKSGIDIILDAAGFDNIIEGATLVITGEGKIDFQSSRGKVIDGICRRCHVKNVPVLAIAGIVDDNTDNHSTSTTRTSPTELSSRNNSNPLLTIRAIGPRPQNESDLEYAMRPEVARKNISDTVSRYLSDTL
jgi:glycerate kinase